MTTVLSLRWDKSCPTNSLMRSLMPPLAGYTWSSVARPLPSPSHTHWAPCYESHVCLYGKPPAVFLTSNQHRLLPRLLELVHLICAYEQVAWTLFPRNVLVDKLHWWFQFKQLDARGRLVYPPVTFHKGQYTAGTQWLLSARHLRANWLQFLLVLMLTKSWVNWGM